MTTEMNLKTWTRKATAEAAVKKALEGIDEKFQLTGVTGRNVSTGAAPDAFAVDVFLDNEAEEIAELQEELGETARVLAQEEAEASGTEDSEAAEGEKPKRRQTGPRQPKIPMLATITIAEGVTNPFREGTKNGAAFDLLANNPGITREKFREIGGREKTMTRLVKDGKAIVG